MDRSSRASRLNCSPAGEPTLQYLSEALIVADGTDYGVHSPHLDLPFHRHDSAGGVLPQWTGTARRRMPDLDLVTADGPLRVFELLHDAKPALLNLGERGSCDITPWADRVRLIDAEYVGLCELPVLGAVTAPSAVVIRPDGHVAWVRDHTDLGLREALTTWFGPPTAPRLKG